MAADVIVLPLPDRDSYRHNPKLAGLPKWVRKLQRVLRQLEPFPPLEEQRKGLSKDIAAVLVAGGLARNALVTCGGIEVILRGQDGRSYIDIDALRAGATIKDIPTATIEWLITFASKRGDPSAWTELRVPKAAKVRR